jgi:autotransporter family porin
MKFGVDGKLNRHLNLWSNLGIPVGDKGYNDTSAMVGVKYNF